MGIICQAGLLCLSISFSSVPLLLRQRSNRSNSLAEKLAGTQEGAAGAQALHNYSSLGRDELCPSTFIPRSLPPTSVSLCKESPLSFGNEGPKSHSLRYMDQHHEQRDRMALLPSLLPNLPLLLPNPSLPGQLTPFHPSQPTQKWDFTKPQRVFLQNQAPVPTAGRAGWDKGCPRLSTPLPALNTAISIMKSAANLGRKIVLVPLLLHHSNGKWCVKIITFC